MDEFCGVVGVGVVDFVFYVVDIWVGDVSECIWKCRFIEIIVCKIDIKFMYLFL